MSSVALPLDWKPDKRAAARLLAIGCSQQYTADQVGVVLRTVQNWCADPEFDNVRQELQELAWASVEPTIMANVQHALEVQRMVFRGDLNAGDKRYIAAEKLIYRMLDRLLYVEPATAEDRTPAITATFNLPAGNA